jgi:hypothetical protein
MESSLILTIDRLGQRYGMLPSNVISLATTFDLVIMDSALSIEQYFRESQEKGHVPNMSTEELLKIKERAG